MKPLYKTLSVKPRPKGVMTAVLGTSSGWIGIWWSPFILSFFENITFPAKFAVKSWIRGIGYRSNSVHSFSLLKSPHGRHSPLGFGTTCNGEEYWLFDLRAIPSLTRVPNSSFDTLNFSGESLLA